MPSEEDDRKRRIAAIVNGHLKLAPGAPAPGPLSINGGRNVIALHDIIIVDSLPQSKKLVTDRASRKNTSGRGEFEDLIWRRVWDLALTAEQFYELAGKKLHRPVSVLSKLAEPDLTILYEMLIAMRRPALE